MTAADRQQPDLFGAAMPPRQPRQGSQPLPVAAATAGAGFLALAARLPPGLRIGTSSWSFPGWAGIVYERAHPVRTLAREGLAAYARHPLLRTVGIDRSYYGVLDARTYASYAAMVPADFRFLVKAPEQLTLARFPTHLRYGADAGRHNALFLDAVWAADAVVAPMVDGLGARAGPLVFQFPLQDVAATGGVDGFAERLHEFLAALPRGPIYAVEIRNRALFGERYRQALSDAGATHCVNQHPSMPSPAEQASMLAGDAPLVVRWMLGEGMRYENSRDQFTPFDRLLSPSPRIRGELAALAVGALRQQREVVVVISNKAEGSAALSAVELAREMVARL